MLQAGQIYWADLDRQFPHPVVVLSREELNRGRYVVAAVITSARFAERCRFANCVPIRAGQFGLTKDCVIQAESLSPVPVDQLDLAGGPIGTLDESAFRDLIRAVGYVFESECEPK